MASTKPTVVLVPGAWHSPAHYTEILGLFEEAGHPTLCSKLPSVDPSNPDNQTVAADVDFIREQLLLPLIDDGKDILLVMHSYGGCPGGAAALGLSKSEKSSGGIIGLIFIAAFLAREGDSLLSALGGKFDPFVIVDENTGLLTVDNPADVFYGDVPEPRLSQAIAALKPHSRTSLSSPSPPSAWAQPTYNGRRAYIQATQDHSVPLIAQEMMVKHSGVDWIIKVLDSSHSPFLSNPKVVADTVLEIAAEFHGQDH